MKTFIRIGQHIVNLDHIVDATRFEAEPAKTKWDYDARADRTVAAKPVRVVLTLTALELESIDDYGDGPGRAAASQSQTITIKGDQAEVLWQWLSSRAINLDVEQVAA